MDHNTIHKDNNLFFTGNLFDNILLGDNILQLHQGHFVILFHNDTRISLFNKRIKLTDHRFGIRFLGKADIIASIFGAFDDDIDYIVKSIMHHFPARHR